MITVDGKLKTDTILLDKSLQSVTLEINSSIDKLSDVLVKEIKESVNIPFVFNIDDSADIPVPTNDLEKDLKEIIKYKRDKTHLLEVKLCVLFNIMHLFFQADMLKEGNRIKWFFMDNFRWFLQAPKKPWMNKYFTYLS